MKITQHRDNDNKNVNMHVIVTIIGNPLFSIQIVCPVHYYKKYMIFTYSYFKIYMKLLQLALTLKLNMHHHSSLELLLVLKPLA